MRCPSCSGYVASRMVRVPHYFSDSVRSLATYFTMTLPLARPTIYVTPPCGEGFSIGIILPTSKYRVVTGIQHLPVSYYGSIAGVLLAVVSGWVC